MGKLEKAVYFMCQNFSSKEDCINKLEVIKSSPANLAPVKTESSVSCLQLLVLATEQSQLVTLPTRPVISGSTSLEPQPVPDPTTPSSSAPPSYTRSTSRTSRRRSFWP